MERSIISNSTLIPLGLVGAIVGVAFYFFDVKSVAVSTREQVGVLDQRVNKVEETNTTLLDRTARMETKIDFLVGRFDPKSSLLKK